ncbi:MAG TPA: amino acid adenylation domain-containing protein, partial [Pyrinomonadaceae bacterium]
ELEIQYADYAAWQRKWLAGEMLQEQLRYWKGQLAGAPPLLELPTDKPRPPIQSHHGAEIRFSLDAELSRALNALGQQEQTTLFMTLLAAFQTLLSRYSGQRDICVGSPIAGRNRTEIEGLIGFFVNTLVLRTDLSGEPTLRELMRRVKEVCLGAYGHQDVPFEKLVEELQPVRQMSQSPLFQVMFVLQNMAAQPAHLPELQISEVEVENRMAKFDLTLIMVETAEGLQGVIEYNTDLFDQRRIERLIEHYKMVLEAMVEDAGQVVSRVPLLRDDERRQLLTGWNETAREYGSHLRLHEHFEAQVERTPHAVALVYDGEQLSYLELNARANKLAHHLQKLGVGPEVLVGVLMERSLEMVVSLLAILKAGGAYVPLDPLYPQERLSFMLADATVSVLLTQRRLREQALAISHPSELICVDDEWAEIAGQCSDNPDAPLMDDNLAYVIFTSGSTGRPKGAMNTHRAICNRLLWMQETYGLTADDRVMQKTPFSFDVSVWEFFWPLMTGARLVIARPGGHQEPAYLINLIRQEQVTTLHFVPSMLQVFLEERGVDKCESLRRVICSGEALSPALEERFFARLDGSELHNLYGPTEAAVDVTSWACERARARHVVPIGRPIANIQTYIVDEWMQAVPVGVAGELCIGGVGLARGYLRRAGMTAEKFVPNPFGAERGERLYRTGDLARYLPDGAIEYLARMDNQVKLRGFRIELGEVEAVLTQHAAVQDAMVLALDDPSKGKRLVAYLIPDRQRARAVRQFLRLEKEGRLAEHASYELPNGMTVMHLNRGETEFLYQEIFAEHSYLKNGIKLREGDCVFDVGANIGLFSLFVKQHCPQARLYAFEPLPPLFEVLKMNMALHAEDVKVFECGLSNETRGETFTFYPHCSIISGQHADAAQEREVVRSFLLHDGAGDEISAGMMEELLSARLESESYECRLKTLSEVMADEGVERIDLLKVDVEKSEMEVLGGIREEDWPKIRQLIVEVHDVEGRLERVKTLLREHGYELTVEQDSTLKETALYNIYALRSAGEECHACNGIFESQPGVDVEPRYGSLQELKREVRAHLKEKLPEYMVPSAFVLLEQWPLTPNGKIDRRALLACEERQEESRADYVAPRTPVEELLAEMCSVVLGLERVGVEDNFFELGGHSLLAIQLISRARDSFAVEIPLRSLFEAPTIARLAEEIEKAREQPGSQPQVPAITPISRGAHRMKRSAIEM